MRINYHARSPCTRQKSENFNNSSFCPQRVPRCQEERRLLFQYGVESEACDAQALPEMRSTHPPAAHTSMPGQRFGQLRIIAAPCSQDRTSEHKSLQLALTTFSNIKCGLLHDRGSEILCYPNYTTAENHSHGLVREHTRLHQPQ